MGCDAMKPGDLVRINIQELRKTKLDQIGIVVEVNEGLPPKVLFPSDNVIATVLGECLEVIHQDVESRGSDILQP